MKLMTWSDHFDTDIDVIDAQHRTLVDLINAAAPLLSQSGDAAAREVQSLLDRMAEYALGHFSCEEEMMAERGIDSRYQEHHQGIHAFFVREVALMREELLADRTVSGNDLLRFLISWLSIHILTEDQQMARQLRAIEAGASAEQAYEGLDKGSSAAVTVLTDAMIEMSSLLTERNQELAASKENLEARVVERTQELESERAALLAAGARIEQAQERLLQSEKMSAVGQLASGVAREIHDPIGDVMSNLAALTGYFDQLLARLVAYEAIRVGLPAEHPGHLALEAARGAAEPDFLRKVIPDLLRDSNDSLARVKRIVGDLKDFSRAADGEWQPTDINLGLESALNAVSNEIHHQAGVFKELGELPLVNCIPAQINQVFMNLLANAAHAIGSAGRITLRTGVAGDGVWIEVADTGQGMTPEVKRRIFEPFFTTKPVGQGTGLGLSITWEVVDRHRGRIEVESAPGRGSTFRLSLPVERAPA